MILAKIKTKEWDSFWSKGNSGWEAIGNFSYEPDSCSWDVKCDGLRAECCQKGRENHKFFWPFCLNLKTHSCLESVRDGYLSGTRPLIACGIHADYSVTLAFFIFNLLWGTGGNGPLHIISCDFSKPNCRIPDWPELILANTYLMYYYITRKW